MPKPKPHIKTTISDAQLHSELLRLFEKGNTDKGKCKEVLRSKYKLQEQRYYKKYAIALQEWQQTRQKADKEQIQINAKVGLKSGLKSKIEKQQHLQKQIDDTQSDLDTGITIDYVALGGKLQKVSKEMSVETKAYLRKTIRELYAELNKMEGDYAPTKTAQTNVNGEDVQQVIIINGKEIKF